MIRRPPRSTLSSSSAASDVYKRQLRRTPTLAVPMGSANDFAATLGIDTVEQALTAWKQFCETRENSRLIDLGTIQPLHPVEAAEMLPALRDDDPDSWEGDSLETLHFVADG